jgi:hypothetical protein
MYYSPFKPLLLGLGVAFALFVLPFFLLKAALLLLVFGLVFRLGRYLFVSRMFGARGSGSQRAPWGVSWHPMHPHRVWTDTIRAMSDDDYQSFRHTLRPEQPGVARTTIHIQ